MDKRVAERKAQFDLAQGKKTEVKSSEPVVLVKSDPIAIPVAKAESSTKERRARVEEAVKRREEKRKTKV